MLPLTHSFQVEKQYVVTIKKGKINTCKDDFPFLCNSSIFCSPASAAFKKHF